MTERKAAYRFETLQVHAGQAGRCANHPRRGLDVGCRFGCSGWGAAQDEQLIASASDIKTARFAGLFCVYGWLFRVRVCRSLGSRGAG